MWTLHLDCLFFTMCAKVYDNPECMYEYILPEYLSVN